MEHKKMVQVSFEFEQEDWELFCEAANRVSHGSVINWITDTLWSEADWVVKNIGEDEMEDDEKEPVA